MADDRSAQALAADIAVLRMTGEPGGAEMFRAFSTDKGKSDEEVRSEFGRVARQLMETTHAALHVNGKDHTDEELINGMFLAGFVYGRAFEELQVLELDGMNNLTLTSRKGTKK